MWAQQWFHCAVSSGRGCPGLLLRVWDLAMVSSPSRRRARSLPVCCHDSNMALPFRQPPRLATASLLALPFSLLLSVAKCHGRLFPFAWLDNKVQLLRTVRGKSPKGHLVPPIGCMPAAQRKSRPGISAEFPSLGSLFLQWSSSRLPLRITVRSRAWMAPAQAAPGPRRSRQGPCLSWCTFWKWLFRRQCSNSSSSKR